MNYLVLGGAGFIGSHVVDGLLAAGHQVRVFDRPDCDLDNLCQARDRIDLWGGDFTQADDLTGALEDIDLVIHLVGTVLPATSNLDPLYDIETNLKSTVKLLQLAVEKGVKKVVFASSGGQVYGPVAALPISETNPTEPLSSYGIIKLTTEKYLKLFHQLYNLDYTILRIANPYGERQKTDARQGAIAVFSGRIKKRQPIEIWGDGSVARDYLYIADLVQAVLKACSRSLPFKLFNIGRGRPLSLNELVRLLMEVSGREVPVIYKEARSCDSPVNFLDCQRASHYLEWEPQVDFRIGLQRTWEWVLAHG